VTSYIAAIDHPSLYGQIQPFVDGLRAESRRFGAADRCNPKPFPSLVRKVSDPQRLRFGAMLDGRLVGMCSLSRDGEVAVVLDHDHRGQGHGTLLLSHVIQTATKLSFPRLVMETSRRSRPVSRLSERFGWTSIERGHGRVELILNLTGDRIAGASVGA
jgi:GNAT superfamily N-acetyltransferase